MSYSEHKIEGPAQHPSLHSDWEIANARTLLERLVNEAKDPKNAGREARNALEELPRLMAIVGKTEQDLDFALSLEEETRRHMIIEADFCWQFVKHCANSKEDNEANIYFALNCEEPIKTLLKRAGENLATVNITQTEFDEAFKKLKIKSVLIAYNHAIQRIGYPDCAIRTTQARQLCKEYGLSARDLNLRPEALKWMNQVLAPEYYGKPMESPTYMM